MELVLADVDHDAAWELEGTTIAGVLSQILSRGYRSTSSRMKEGGTPDQIPLATKLDVSIMLLPNSSQLLAAAVEEVCMVSDLTAHVLIYTICDIAGHVRFSSMARTKHQGLPQLKHPIALSSVWLQHGRVSRLAVCIE